MQIKEITEPGVYLILVNGEQRSLEVARGKKDELWGELGHWVGNRIGIGNDYRFAPVTEFEGSVKYKVGEFV